LEKRQVSPKRGQTRQMKGVGNEGVGGPKKGKPGGDHVGPGTISSGQTAAKRKARVTKNGVPLRKAPQEGKDPPNGEGSKH